MRAADDSGSAAAVVRASLAEYASRLVELAPAVIADEPDAVHQARVLAAPAHEPAPTWRRCIGFAGPRVGCATPWRR